MMKILYTILVSIILVSCAEKPEDVQNIDTLPEIFPDYEDVTVPANIAPLNFSVNKSSNVYAELTGDDGTKISTIGSYADFDIEQWHNLTIKNKGNKITVSVTAKIDEIWKKYKDFIYLYQQRFAQRLRSYLPIDTSRLSNFCSHWHLPAKYSQF